MKAAIIAYLVVSVTLSIFLMTIAVGQIQAWSVVPLYFAFLPLPLSIIAFRATKNMESRGYRLFAIIAMTLAAPSFIAASFSYILYFVVQSSFGGSII